MKNSMLAQGSIAFNITQLINTLGSNEFCGWAEAGLSVRVHRTNTQIEVDGLAPPKRLIFDIEPLSSELQKHTEPYRLTITQRMMEQLGTPYISVYEVQPTLTGSIHYICVDKHPEPGSLGEIFLTHLLGIIPKLLGFPQPSTVPA